jgi:molecular chaperone DnaJ
MRTYYQVLGVSENAPADEVRRAYRRLARRHHPDVAGCSGTLPFREVRQAYETLSDEKRRRTYDERLAADRAPMLAQEGYRRWFADEIAIDFPSVSELVDRIREALLGPDDGPAPLQAEVLLSVQEASSGVTVPLDVPVRSTCQICGGRGETWMEWCWVCGGSGNALSEHRVRVSVPPGVADGARFRFSVAAPYAPPTRVEVRVAVR